MRLPEMAERLFLVFQEPSAQLFSPTIEDELCFAPENLLWEREKIEPALTAALQRVGLTPFRYSSPDCLSGGQQQLATMGAAFVTSPKIYLFDEALSQLDDDTRGQLLSFITELAEQGNAVVMVEHNSANMEIAHRILRFEDGILKEEKNRSLR